MKRYPGISFAFFCSLSVVASFALAKEARQIHHIVDPRTTVDIVGDVDGTLPKPQKVLQDTIWIAEWTFDGGFPCTDAGWDRVDNRTLARQLQPKPMMQTEVTTFWEVSAAFDSTGGILSNAAALGYSDDPCCLTPSGYGNDWYQAMRIEYRGSGFLSFDYLLDSEGSSDFLRVETDSACSSFDRVDFDINPGATALSFRDLILKESGLDLAGRVDSLAVTSYDDTLSTHCLYIAFLSDSGFSPCDGLQPSSIGEALVVDNVELIDVPTPINETFEAAQDSAISFVSLQEGAAFGSWGRVFFHITDNDICSENETCAWLWTDYTTPTVANDPSMAFGPDAFVVKNWLDESIVSPWVSLSTTPSAVGTILEFRRFPGNFFAQSRVVQNWGVRGRVSVDDGMGGTVSCVSDWGHAFDWQALSFFGWLTFDVDMTADFDAGAEEIQVRHRTSDWQWLVRGFPAPEPFIPGPGPFVDRTRIGRQVLTGPVITEGIDARSQAQDAFATEIDPTITPGTGEHFRPTIDRFGTAAFSQGSELGINNASPNLITGDSIWVEVLDVRDATGISSIDWYGAIVRGPHQGKAPPPYSVGTNGFFALPADSVRTPSGVVLRDHFFVDLSDSYFRGGDELHYFWLASDGLGGVTSNPTGLTSVPASIEAAQSATNGMLEVSFLPTIDWDPTYLAAIAADDHGDLDPTAEQLAASSQANCILYANQVNTRRRSGLGNRTSFMYTLDQLGYRSHYDVYDHTGLGNTNNQLGGRATTQQAQGYNLIVWDVGDNGPSGWLMPDGSDDDVQKIDQAGWFQSWLAQASLGESEFATLWVIGSNILEEKPTNPLYAIEMQLGLAANGQNTASNPDVEGQTSFTFTQNGGATCMKDFTGDVLSLDAGCPFFRDYDALTSLGTGVATHLFKSPLLGATGDAAIVMNTDAAQAFNTVHQSFPWFDIVVGDDPPASPEPEALLMQKILGCVLPPDCQLEPNPVDVPGDDEISTPRRTVLHGNVPNPFNPTTTIRFDLAHTGHVRLRIYDVAGRLVRTLVDEKRAAAFGHMAVWNGMDDRGQRTSSGVYFYRLEAGSHSETRKLVMLK
jgi:hypothetical protein